MLMRLARVMLALLVFVAIVAAAPAVPPTKMLRSPTVSATRGSSGMAFGDSGGHSSGRSPRVPLFRGNLPSGSS